MRKFLPILALCVAAATMIAATSADPEAAFGTGSISGVITDATTGSPVAGAKVMAGCCSKSAITGEDGSYTIANLAAGTYTVKAMKMGEYPMKQYPTPVELADGQQVTGIDIALTPEGGGGEGSISGTVYDKATNEPIAGAKVMVGGCGNSATTGDDGTYTISGLANGSYNVKAMKSGYKCGMYPDPVVITNGETVEGIDIYLTYHAANQKKMGQAK